MADEKLEFVTITAKAKDILVRVAEIGRTRRVRTNVESAIGCKVLARPRDGGGMLLNQFMSDVSNLLAHHDDLSAKLAKYHEELEQQALLLLDDPQFKSTP